MASLDLTGKNILVTGASRGIGRAITLELVEHGANVIGHYNSSKEEASELSRKAGKNLVMMRANLAKNEHVRLLFDRAVAEFGHLDVLVNNAGLAISSDPDGDDEKWLDDWDLTQAVNLRALAYLCKLGVEHFKTIEGGRLINISSRAAFRGDTEFYLAYAASKGGVVALTRSIARAYGKENIKAFNIAPGFVMTDMAQDFVDQYGESFIKDDLALDQLTQPEDIAHMVTFLASGLGDHATGGTFDINAGSYVH